MEDAKKAFVSGKLSGTRSMVSDIESLSDPDDVEKFLLEFSSIKFEFDTNNPIKYINDDQDFLECLEIIDSSKYISIHPTPSFSRLYITTDDKCTYIIRLNKVSTALIATFIAKEQPIKFALNSFAFIKWCNSKNIDMRNIFDIPTYIKLLTNDVDPFKTVDDYITQYTSYALSETDNETNSIIIGNFIYEFGKYLESYIDKFELSTVCKSINENTYFEGSTFNNSGKCIINVSYTNLSETIDTIASEIQKKYEKNVYVVSPLNRIAPKFGHTTATLIKELYSEDIIISLLNEFYNNNIPTKLNDDNSFTITCKYKNFSNVLSITTAILNEVFFVLFSQSPEIHLDCILKE